MGTSTYYRRQAACCLSLAKSSLDTVSAERLRLLAQDYLDKASFAEVAAARAASGMAVHAHAPGD